MSLFRPEVIAAQRRPWMGEILVTRPLSTRFFTLAALTLAVTLSTYLALGEYTRKERLSGVLVSTAGLARIYSPVTGMVVKKLVREGEQVQRGQQLYLISVDRPTANGDTQSAVGAVINAKQLSLDAQLLTQRQVLAEEDKALQRRVSDLRAQQVQLQGEIAVQLKRLDLEKKSLERFQQLSDSKFISAAQLIEREQQWLEQDSRLRALQRTELVLRSDIATAESDLRNAPRHARNQLATIERGIFSARQESHENEAKREVVVRAPYAGQATAVITEAGQTVSPAAPLLSILPDTGFEANLYAPSRAIGFVTGGEKVSLRYDAFPFQKYGQYQGVIKSVSRTALSGAELPYSPASSEPMYLIKVALRQQQVQGFGKHFALQDGMRLEADVALEKRKLYEWVLAPLYSLTGKWGDE